LNILKTLSDGLEAEMVLLVPAGHLSVSGIGCFLRLLLAARAGATQVMN
jgi:hypothetical protein